MIGPVTPLHRALVALLWLVMAMLAGAIVFGCAGRFDLPGVWIVLGSLVFFGVILATVANDGLLRERLRPKQGNQDRLTQPLSLVVMVSQWAIAGLDARYGWSQLPLTVVVAGGVGYAAALFVVLWAMLSNPFYSSVVRVQSDRGQTPISSGPYAIVRHPGYTGSILAALCGGLAFGSGLAMIPIAIFITLFLRRTLLEDRHLQSNLPGYSEYAQRVRYRLIPGLL
jgi:protein-S-isoprenylcysteine O-methyltransferase Ste14